jgi:hypothetical protein
MERRYIGVLTGGQPRQVIDRISRVVKTHDLARTIPVIKVEKKARGQFYVFLAVEGLESSYLPESVKTVLRESGLNKQATPPLELSEIKSMVSGADFEIEGLNSISYKPRWTRELGDPFDSFSAHAAADTEEDAEIGVRYNHLLYWLSTTGEGSWGTFVNACHTLNLIKDNMTSQRIQRCLTLLGHIECSIDGKHWTVCTPTLVQDPANPEIGFLCGARTPKLLDEVGKHWNIEVVLQPHYKGPDCIRVACGELPEDRPFELDKSLSIFVAGVSSTKLAQALPDLDGWMDTLTVIDRLSTANYIVEWWNGEEYLPCYECIEKDNQYVGKSGLYRLTRSEGERSYSINLYLDRERQRWLKGDWYGLRFLALHAAGAECKAVRDKEGEVLMIPTSAHLPMLFERSLVLASGRLPSRSTDYEWLRYERTSEELTQMLMDKLKFQVEERNHV